jgi:AcrR family transcriptional regulator
MEWYSSLVDGVKNRQQVAADETRRAIVDAAARLFAADGYHATSVARIASEAGVAVQTVYNSVGSKIEVLSRVLDHAAAGERAPTPVPVFMLEQAQREPDPRRVIAQLVEFWRGAVPRTAPVFRLIREAAAVDADAAALERARAAQRLGNYGLAGQVLADRGALRAELSVDEAAAVIFSIGHPEVYRALVLEGDWDDERWAAWVQSALEAALLEPVDEARPGIPPRSG